MEQTGLRLTAIQQPLLGFKYAHQHSGRDSEFEANMRYTRIPAAQVTKQDPEEREREIAAAQYGFTRVTDAAWRQISACS